jgi:hypothetical protein
VHFDTPSFDINKYSFDIIE